MTMAMLNFSTQSMKPCFMTSSFDDKLFYHHYFNNHTYNNDKISNINDNTFFNHHHHHFHRHHFSVTRSCKSSIVSPLHTHLLKSGTFSKNLSFFIINFMFCIIFIFSCMNYNSVDNDLYYLFFFLCVMIVVM